MHCVRSSIMSCDDALPLLLAHASPRAQQRPPPTPPHLGEDADVCERAVAERLVERDAQRAEQLLEVRPAQREQRAVRLGDDGRRARLAREQCHLAEARA